MKNQQAVLYGIIGLLLGIVLTVVFASSAVNTNNSQLMGMMGMKQMGSQSYSSGMDRMHEQMMGNDEMTMDGMVNSLKGLKGEDFDRAFIEQMISHHEGAIDMAELAKQYAFHDEIKNLADDIISAQTSEINMMKQWQGRWGY